LKCGQCAFEGVMDQTGEVDDDFFRLSCPACGLDPTTKPGYAYSQQGSHCSLCGQAFGMACDGTHPLCILHGAPIVGECLQCLVEG